MATLKTAMESLATATGQKIEVLAGRVGALGDLNTPATSLVAAINAVTAQATGLIDDSATSADTDSTLSASKIHALIAAAKDALLNGAGSALDTLKELADALGNDPNFAATVAMSLANRVAFDVLQNKTVEQQAIAQQNIGLGDLTNANFVALLNAASPSVVIGAWIDSVVVGSDEPDTLVTSGDNAGEISSIDVGSPYIVPVNSLDVDLFTLLGIV